MNTLVLIPWAETTWSAAGRVAGRTPLPLTRTGQAEVKAWARALATGQFAAVYSSDEQTSIHTATVVAERSGVPLKVVPELSEVDAGLWNGLTTEELKHRYAKTFKKWCSDPSSVCPPQGESIEDAYKRLQKTLEDVLRKSKGTCVGVVLGPLACALVRCRLESVEPSKVHSLVQRAPLRYRSVDGVVWDCVGPLPSPAGVDDARAVVDTGAEC